MKTKCRPAIVALGILSLPFLIAGLTNPPDLSGFLSPSDLTNLSNDVFVVEALADSNSNRINAISTPDLSNLSNDLDTAEASIAAISNKVESFWKTNIPTRSLTAGGTPYWTNIGTIVLITTTSGWYEGRMSGTFLNLQSGSPPLPTVYRMRFDGQSIREESNSIAIAANRPHYGNDWLYEITSPGTYTGEVDHWVGPGSVVGLMSNFTFHIGYKGE